MIGKLLLLMALSGTAHASPVSRADLLKPWPEENGNYLQMYKGDNRQWYMVSHSVKNAKVAEAVAQIVQPKDPSSFLVRSVPGATIFVRGLECESLSYHLVIDSETPQVY
jgi:hypothetical protein